MKILKKIFLSAAVIGAMASGTAQAADKIVLDGSTTVGPIAKAFADHFTKATGVEVTVSVRSQACQAARQSTQRCRSAASTASPRSRRD